jgi:hypothetical protein
MTAENGERLPEANAAAGTVSLDGQGKGAARVASFLKCGEGEL